MKREKKNNRVVGTLRAGRIYCYNCEKVWETRAHRDVKWLLDSRDCYSNELFWAPQYQKRKRSYKELRNKITNAIMYLKMYFQKIYCRVNSLLLVCYIFLSKGIHGSSLILVVFNKANLRRFRYILSYLNHLLWVSQKQSGDA